MSDAGVAFAVGGILAGSRGEVVTYLLYNFVSDEQVRKVARFVYFGAAGCFSARRTCL